MMDGLAEAPRRMVRSPAEEIRLTLGQTAVACGGVIHHALIDRYTANTSPHSRHVRNRTSERILSVAVFTASLGSSKRTVVL
jgi:hypothetical protein